jgi:hypothetical protein
MIADNCHFIPNLRKCILLYEQISVQFTDSSVCVFVCVCVCVCVQIYCQSVCFFISDNNSQEVNRNVVPFRQK